MSSLTPSVVLAAYSEPLLQGRRALVLGASAPSLAERLLERGARAVVVFEPDDGRANELTQKNRNRQITIVSESQAALALPGGGFDVVIVEDLSASERPEATLDRVRRSLSAGGVALICAPNPEAPASLLGAPLEHGGEPLGYYALYDLVSSAFGEVRMLGQTPFVGYALVDFAMEGEPDVTLDSGLVPGGAEEPEWFIALASRDAIEVEPFSIIQIPAASLALGDEEVASSERSVPPGSQAADALKAELEKREAWIASLEARATAADARADQATEKAESLRAQAARAAALEATVRSLTAERDQIAAERKKIAAERDALAEEQKRATGERSSHAETLASLKAGRATDAEALAALRAERTSNAEALAALKAERASNAEALAALKAERASNAEALAALKAERDRLQSESSSAAARLAEVEAERDRVRAERDKKAAELERLLAIPELEGPDDLGRLEQGLLERAERTRKLEADLAEAERLGRELVREIEQLRRGGGQNGETAALAAENARLAADLEAARWTIEELTHRLHRSAEAH